MFECAFLASRQVDSFQKLSLLFWLYPRRAEGQAVQELASQLFIADLAFLERMLAELAATGLVERSAGSYRMVHSREIDYCMECLKATFDDPLARQGLLATLAALGGGYDGRLR